MADPTSVDEWWSLVKQHEAAAKMLCDNRDAAKMGYDHAALAVECALKALIWHRERFNVRPSREERPELYSHNLRQLKDAAEIKVKHSDASAACWFVVLQWDRGQYYDPKRMPRKVARAMVDAAFGDVGVVTWVRKQIFRK
ncbi:hypothetical protein [Agrobacterium pusense]|uniref:HEPN domain-containing protein n=1 Tax=Agrobacterium pusense TaxID=648995 RepID=A0AA44J2C4_9HYPH|nr:hypothetical protein [Agrobacterium pusense]NRF12176.1 hypothetical protein [Agrobacterium pusense]NRF22886.1 hypothetical protein [Agrobacterium pusense]